MPMLLAVVRSSHKMQACLLVLDRVKSKWPVVCFSSIVPALVFQSRVSNQGQFVLKGFFCLLLFWLEPLSSQFFPLTLSVPPILAFAFFSAEKEWPSSLITASAPLPQKAYIPWYSFSLLYKILFLILPTHFGLRLTIAFKKVSSENKLTTYD